MPTTGPFGTVGGADGQGSVRLGHYGPTREAKDPPGLWVRATHPPESYRTPTVASRNRLIPACWPGPSRPASCTTIDPAPLPR